MKNDERIKKLLALIDEKKKALGKKPPAIHMQTNGVYRTLDKDCTYTLHVIQDESIIIMVVADLIGLFDNWNKAKVLLETDSDEEFSYCGFSFSEWMADLKSTSKRIAYTRRKRELDILERKLKDLLSEDAKTENVLDELEKELK